MTKWEITWRDGFVEGFSTANTTDDIQTAVQYILECLHPIEIKITRRSN